MASNNMANLIPHCISNGQAAGAAAAIAIKKGISPRKVDVRVLQERLLEQGVVLPGIELAVAK
jgi:hypothetical protein